MQLQPQVGTQEQGECSEPRLTGLTDTLLDAVAAVVTLDETVAHGEVATPSGAAHGLRASCRRCREAVNRSLTLLEVRGVAAAVALA